MSRFTKLFAALLLVAGTSAFALQQLDKNVSRFLSVIQSGLVLAPERLLVSDSVINTHAITRSLAGSVTFDFASQTITCNTTTLTVTGARSTDVCMVSPGTVGGAANSSFSCYVSAADTVLIKHCPAGTASDPASQPYYVRVFSNTAN